MSIKLILEGISYKDLARLIQQVRNEKIQGKQQSLSRLVVLLLEYAGASVKDLVNCKEGRC